MDGFGHTIKSLLLIDVLMVENVLTALVTSLPVTVQINMYNTCHKYIISRCANGGECIDGLGDKFTCNCTDKYVQYMS